MVKGVYYKEVMDSLDMPRSTFYLSLRRLEEKEFVQVNWKNGTKDFDMVVLDNAFLKKSDFQEGYLNVNLQFILSEEFVHLNVRVKKFFMRMLGLQAHKKEVKILIDTMKEYKVYNKIKELMRLFNMVLDGEGYLFTVRDRVLNYGSIMNQKPDRHLSYRQRVVAYCRKFNIKYTAKELRDTYLTLVSNVDKGRQHLINKAFDKILEVGRLQPKLISFLCGKAY